MILHIVIVNYYFSLRGSFLFLLSLNWLWQQAFIFFKFDITIDKTIIRFVFVSLHNFATMKASIVLQLILLSALTLANGAKLQIKDGGFQYNGQKVFLSGMISLLDILVHLLNVSFFLSCLLKIFRFFRQY